MSSAGDSLIMVIVAKDAKTPVAAFLKIDYQN